MKKCCDHTELIISYEWCYQDFVQEFDQLSLMLTSGIVFNIQVVELYTDLIRKTQLQV